MGTMSMKSDQANAPAKKGTKEEVERDRYGFPMPKKDRTVTVTMRMSVKTHEVEVDIDHAEWLRPDLLKTAQEALVRALRRSRAEMRAHSKGKTMESVKVTANQKREVKVERTPEELQDKKAAKRSQASSYTPTPSAETEKRKEVFEDVKEMEKSVVEKIANKGA